MNVVLIGHNQCSAVKAHGLDFIMDVEADYAGMICVCKCVTPTSGVSLSVNLASVVSLAGLVGA